MNETHDPIIPSELPIEPNVMLPIQWQAEHGKSQDLAPEQRLLQTMLEDALECFSACPGIKLGLSYSTLAIKTQYEAERWIFLEDSGAKITFQCCCEHLDIDPDLIRERLRPWRMGNQPKLRFPNGYVVAKNRTLVGARARSR